MKLDVTLKAGHSKKQCMLIVHWVGNDPARFSELFSRYAGTDTLLSQRAAWPVSYCVEQYPDLIQPHWKTFFQLLKKAGLHDAIKRNATRLLQYTTIPKKFQGEAMDLCFRLLGSPQEAIATRSFALTVLDTLSKSYPEIVPEIRLLIEDMDTSLSPALKNHTRKWLKKWSFQA